MQADEYLQALQDRSAALLSAADANLDTAVHTCPGWKMADLVEHMGTVWRWADKVVRTGERASFDQEPKGLARDELVGWARRQAEALIDALCSADPTSNCWTFGLPRSRLFWFRRQALEAAVHAFDAERALGEATALDSELATDGLEEFFSVMLPRRIEARPNGWTGETFHFHRNDGEGEWTIRLGPNGTLDVARGHEKGDVAARGAASALYLWCLNRVPQSAIEVFGDLALAEQWTLEVAL